MTNTILWRIFKIALHRIFWIKKILFWTNNFLIYETKVFWMISMVAIKIEIMMHWMVSLLIFEIDIMMGFGIELALYWDEYFGVIFTKEVRTELVTSYTIFFM